MIFRNILTLKWNKFTILMGIWSFNNNCVFELKCGDNHSLTNWPHLRTLAACRICLALNFICNHTSMKAIDAITWEKHTEIHWIGFVMHCNQSKFIVIKVVTLHLTEKYDVESVLVTRFCWNIVESNTESCIASLFIESNYLTLDISQFNLKLIHFLTIT